MIYVMSDIHGNSTRFKSVMEQIELQPNDTLYILGDIIDRGYDGIRILRQLMNMDNVKMLLGNHEYMMLNVLDYTDDDSMTPERAMRIWYRNGGKVTHDYLKHIRKSVRREIFDYLRALPVNIPITVNEKNYLLVHAAPEFMYPIFEGSYANSKEFAVWSRVRPFSLRQEDTIIVFGHTPTMEYQDNNPLEVWTAKTLIGIDCGCAFPLPDEDDPVQIYGRLACVRLDDMKVFYSQENIPEGVEPLA